MKYKIKNSENSVAKITVNFSKEEWEAQMTASYERNKGKYTVQGFRKGHAPRKAIESNYGSSVFFEDALNYACNEAYREILNKETKLFPVDYPQMSLEKMDDKGLQILFTVVCKPEVTLGEYTGLVIEGEKADTSDARCDEEVNKKLNEQIEAYARKVEVTDRLVANGDIVNLDFTGSVNGVNFDGGSAKNYELVIGSHSFIDGFEDQMVGMSIGQEKDLNVTFPENYQSAELAGKPAVFKVKVNKIFVKQLPELTDEWVADVSEYNTINEYKEALKKDYITHAEKQADINNEEKIIQTISEKATVEIPEVMVNNEIDYMMNTLAQRLSYQGLKMEDYYRITGATEEGMREIYREQASKSVKNQLVIEAIIKKENITASEEEIEAKVVDMATRYGKDVEAMKKAVDAKQHEYLSNQIALDKALAFLKQNNTIKFKK